MFIPFPRHKPIVADVSYVVIERTDSRHYNYAFAYYDGTQFYTGENTTIVAFIENPAIVAYKKSKRVWQR